jgi:membrane-bound lytic murein transglycosylase A
VNPGSGVLDHHRAPPVGRVVAFAAAVALAGCATTPPPLPAPTPAPPLAAPLAQPSPVAADNGPRARFAAEPWSALPGWGDDRVEEAWPAWLASCRVLVERPAWRDVWRAPCEAAASVDIRDRRAVRDHFERHLTPWSVAFPDGRTTGLVTGYYEPLLYGSRTPSRTFSVPLYSAPDDLVTVDLAALHPELKDRRVRARVEGRRVVPYWSRADIERGRAALGEKVLVWVADPVDAAFLQIQGSGRVELPDGAVMRVGYADQNGHPYRSIGRVLIDRGELTPDNASMQSIKAWARRNPDKLELRLLPRGRASGARVVRGGDRRAVRFARRAAARRSGDRRRRAGDPARRAGVPRDDLAVVGPQAGAAHARPGHRRRDPRRGARRLLLGLRRRGGTRSRTHAPGRPSVGALAPG